MKPKWIKCKKCGQYFLKGTKHGVIKNKKIVLCNYELRSRNKQSKV